MSTIDVDRRRNTETVRWRKIHRVRQKVTKLFSVALNELSVSDLAR